jgi:hypothetical protein
MDGSTYAGHVVDAGCPGLAPDEPDGRQGDADEDQECHHQTNQEAQVLFHHRLSCTGNRRNDSHWSVYSGPIRRQVLFHYRLSCTRNRNNDSHWSTYSGPIRRLRSCSITDSAAQETVRMILIGRCTVGQSRGSGPIPSQTQLHKKQ